MASAHIGSKVRIKVIEGDEFSGFVHSVDANTGKLTLDKVTLCGRGGVDRRIQGLQHFYGKEIESIIKCEEVCPKLKKNASTGNLTNYKEAGPSLKKTKDRPKHLRNLQRLDTDKLLLSSRHASVEEASNVKSRICARAKSSDYDSSSDISDTNNDVLDSRYHLINKFDNQFYEAMEYLHEQSIIAVSFEGVEVGREGKLAWIPIATKDDLILLDILSLGEKCFTEGFKDILESQKILKVIHDCRLPSDLLHHQYLINLVNVFDTQVADVMIYHVRHRDWPRYVSGLSSCLFSHLELSPEQVHIMRVRESAKQEDQAIWCERPAPEHVMDAAMKHVEHLLDLRLILMEKMMAEFTVGVDIYLAQVKDVSDAEAKKALTSSHLLPFAFQHFSQFLHASHFNYTMPLRMRNPLANKDRHGFEENCQGITDPAVIASVDSIWHHGFNKNCPGFQRKRSKSRNQNLSKEKQNLKPSGVTIFDHEPKTDGGDNSVGLSLQDKPNQVESLASQEAQKKSDTTVFSCGTISSSSEDDKSSPQRPQFVLPRVDSPSEIQQKRTEPMISKSMSNLKLDERSDMSTAELTGSQLLKTLMADVKSSGSSSETDFVLIPAGSVKCDLPKKQKRSLNSATRATSSQPHSESSTCDDNDYFGDIPLKEHLQRNGKLMESRLDQHVPQAIINGGDGRMVISLRASDSDSSDTINSRRFQSLEKQSKELGPILPETVMSRSDCDLPNNDSNTNSHHSFVASMSSKQQISSSFHSSQIQEYVPISVETSSNIKTPSASGSTGNIKTNTYVEEVPSHSVRYVKSDSVLIESPYNRSSSKSEPSPTLTYLSVGRGYRSPNLIPNCQASSSPLQTTVSTPSPVGRAKSSSAADTENVFGPHLGRGRSPGFQTNAASPHGDHCTAILSSYTNRPEDKLSLTTPVSEQMSPISLGRGIKLL